MGYDERSKRKKGCPRIVMQTWKTRDVPEQWKVSPASIKKYNRRWKYVLMTDDDNREFIIKHFPEYLEIYDSFPYNIQRVDFIRYAWLYVHGGIYIDLDFELYCSFDEILSYAPETYDILLVDGTAYQSTNAFMISKAGCNFWLYLMSEIARDRVPWYHRIEKHLYILYSTGPGILLNSVDTYLGNNVISKLPKHAFPVVSADETGHTTFSAKKLEGTSWVTGMGHIYLFIFCNLTLSVIICLLIVMVLVIFYVKRYRKTS